MALTVCWSVKGGSGTTVVASLLALCSKRPSLLVDLDGDAPEMLGIAPPAGQGLSDWFDTDVTAAAIDDLAVDVDRSTRVVPLGLGRLDPSSARWGELAAWLRAPHRFDIVVDAGLGMPHPELRLPGDAGRTLLVIRPCYMALRRAAALTWRADGVVLIDEPGRSLGSRAIEHSLGIPVVMRCPLDPAIARAVDSGLMAGRLPRSVEHLGNAA